MIAVETRSLRHVYPARRKTKGGMALKGVDFSVMKGEVFGFLGPNGSGKTTLFKILSTLIEPSEGTALIFGNDVVQKVDAARKRMGIVFQYPSLDKKLTVEENLTHQGHLYALSGAPLHKRVEEMMERFGLTARRAEYVEHLSGGYRRRVELAKGLIHSPDLLILDEPSTGLDPVARRELWDTIDALKKKNGMTVLVTTHLGEEGERCDRLAIMYEGAIIATGTPDALKAEIGGDVITIDCAEPELLLDQLDEKFGVRPVLVDGRLRCERPNGHELIPKLVEAFPGRITAISLGKPTLEDVFVHKTGRMLWLQGEEAAVKESGDE